MSGAGTFPFGWVRGYRKDNWQLIWDPKTGILQAKAALSKDNARLGEFSNWEEAKAFADRVISDPAPYFPDGGAGE